MSTTEDTLVISAYTRREALVDGEQICLSEQCPEGCAMYKYPVYATRAVWASIQEAIPMLGGFANADEELGQDLVGVVHDLMWMSQANAQTLRPNYSAFQCIVNGAERSPDTVLEGGNQVYNFVLSCGPFDIDDPTPVLTLMFPEED